MIAQRAVIRGCPFVSAIAGKIIMSGAPTRRWELLSKCNINLISIKYSRRYAFAGYNLPSNYQFALRCALSSPSPVSPTAVPSITFVGRWRFNSPASENIPRAPAATIFIDVANHRKAHCLKGRLSAGEEKKREDRERGREEGERKRVTIASRFDQRS